MLSGATLAATIDRLALSVRDAESRTQLGYADPSGQVWVQADGLWYRRSGLEAPCRGIVAVDDGEPRIAHPWERDRLVSRLPRHRGIVVGAGALTLLVDSGLVVTLECAPPLERFEEVIARCLSGVYLLDRAVLSTPPGLPRDLRRALDEEKEGLVPGATVWHRRALEMARAALPEPTRSERLGRRIERAVRMGGAALRRWFEVSEAQSVVVWESRGRRVTTHVRSADLSVISAGICVSGEDRVFDLVALCSAVMRQPHSR
ncbi:MAG: hypothetical protein GY719_33290 [bacterium]|nr:hypothetical protein [bacterium]